jgi:hexosaminidase
MLGIKECCSYFHTQFPLNFNHVMKRLFLFSSVVASLSFFASSCSQKKAAAPVVSIIPKPVSVVRQQGVFTIKPGTRIVLADTSLQNSADFFNEYLHKYYGFTLRVKTAADTADLQEEGAIVLNYTHSGDTAKGAYTLVSGDKQVRINGDDAPGVFYGIQTLIQLLPTTPARSLDIAQVRIKDHPRFQYRGMMLDCGRHFFDTAFIKQFIDFIALHKMNTFHWHLTEDQGWRIQIKKYPKLTDVGAWRDSTLIGHEGDKPRRFDHHRTGGFYTQDEIRAIVRYAQARYITVIPEIEMPGHSMAAIAAYPELTCNPGPYHVGNHWGVYDTILCPTPYTFNFYENVLTEVMELFPSHYIHIGGDEAPKVTWNNSAYCKQLMKKLHLKNADELQSYFINHMEKFLNAHGRDIIGWDEILQGGLAPNATVMSWRGEKGGIAAAKMHHKVIMSPTTYVYLDYYQSRNHDSLFIGGYLPLEKVYSYNPIPPELDSTEAGYIQGVQANLWTEYIKYPTKAEFQLFPRMEAVAEIAWTPQKERNYSDFIQRVQTQFKRYQLWKVSYSRAIYELNDTVEQRSDYQGVDLKLSTKYAQGKIYYTTDGAEPSSKATLYTDSVHITKNAQIRAALFIDGKKMGPEVTRTFQVNKATGKPVTLADPPADKYSQGGAFALVDGVVPAHAKDGSQWLGWNGGDLDAKIDLGKTQAISAVNVTIGDAPGMWVYAPKSITVLGSDDGKDFKVLKQISVQENMGQAARRITVPLAGISARYVEVKAENFGTIPAGHPGAGEKSWLFAGEIAIE